MNEESAFKSFPFRQSGLKQIPMYPKDLVYPNGENTGVEVQLEMIRALRYQENSSMDGCDMDMTEACPNNITVNVPVIPSVEKGKKIHIMQQKINHPSLPVPQGMILYDTTHWFNILEDEIVDSTERNIDLVETEQEMNDDLQEIQEKENLPPLVVPPKTFNFTPSVSEDCSINSYR